MRLTLLFIPEESMDQSPRKITLRKLHVTELADANAEGAVMRSLPDGSSYWVRPGLVHDVTGSRKKIPCELDAFPFVLHGNGVPWYEANIFLFERRLQGIGRSTATSVGLADDLTAFLSFIEGAEIDWTHFPTHRNSKPTYRYRSYLIHEVWSGKLKPSTAKRRMGAVIRFYRWAIESGVLSLQNAPWRETDKLITVSRDFGSAKPLRIRTTDLAITVPVHEEQMGNWIDDGGRLRPLQRNEQQWIIEALEALGNTEMLLIHLFSLLTGARIQTVLTFKLKQALEIDFGRDSLYYPVGPGTGIDTKGGKKMSLYIPRWFYELLKVYAHSERRRIREERSSTSLAKEYLFLSVRGSPMYVARQDERTIQAYGGRYRKNGQAVRQYMADYVIPWINERHEKKFSYQFHDLRASFGMNLVDQFSSELATGSMSYTSLLNLVQDRLCHSSPVTTERYLKFRSKRKMVEAVQSDWEDHLAALSLRAIGRQDAGI